MVLHEPRLVDREARPELALLAEGEAGPDVLVAVSVDDPDRQALSSGRPRFVEPGSTTPMRSGTSPQMIAMCSRTSSTSRPPERVGIPERVRGASRMTRHAAR